MSLRGRPRLPAQSKERLPLELDSHAYDQVDVTESQGGRIVVDHDSDAATGRARDRELLR